MSENFEKISEEKVKENWSLENDLKETMEDIENLNEFKRSKEEYLKKEEDSKKIEEN